MKYLLGKADARADWFELARDASQGFEPPEVATIQAVGQAAGEIQVGQELEVFQETIHILKESQPDDL